MKRRYASVAALCVATALALTACSSSGNGSSSASGATTLKLVAADYGTGPSNTSQKYWQGIADAFHKANPSITVHVQTINWNDFDNQVQTMVQNKQYPDITEGDYFANYAQEGLLYKASDVISNPVNLLPVFVKTWAATTTSQYGMPFTTSSRTLFYNKKLFTAAGITSAPQTWSDVQADAADDQGDSATSASACRSARRRHRPSRCCGCSATAATTPDSSGKWTINSAQNVETFQFLKQLVAVRRHRAEPGHQEPHRPVEAVRPGPDRHDQRLAGTDPDHPGGQGAHRL